MPPTKDDKAEAENHRRRAVELCIKAKNNEANAVLASDDVGACAPRFIEVLDDLGLRQGRKRNLHQIKEAAQVKASKNARGLWTIRPSS